MQRKIIVWARDNGIPSKVAAELLALADKRAEQATNVCNGEAHPDLPQVTDKSKLATRWQQDNDATDALLESVAASVGLTVDYPGLYPTFHRAEHTIYMPG